MKKRLMIFMTLIIFLICYSPVVTFAEGESDSKYSENYYMPPVVDKGEFLTESELEDVSVALDKVRETYGIDVALYTEDFMSGISAMETADDLYDYNDYGAGENNSGIMLYVSENPREYWFTTCGDGIETFNDAAIEHLKNAIVDYMSDDDYYSAFMSYADTVEEILVQINETGKPYEEQKNFVMIIGLAIIIGLVIGFIAAKIMTKRREDEMNTAIEGADADEYVKRQSLNIEVSRDIYLYSNVVAIKKAESESSGTHSSSSGSSHGGGGGSY